MKSYIKRAKFISGNPDWNLVCPIFKKSFDTQKTIAEAVIEISALGVYECHINGERVGDAYMTPGWTVYHKRVLYNTYDVTNMLKKHNKITVGVGHGWFASKLGWGNHTGGVWSNFPAFACALHIVYSDGSEDVILSDTSWKVAKSQVLKSQIYDGEVIDARIRPNFSENARIFKYDTKLMPADGEKVKITERIAVKEVITTPKGELVLDFGQNITGCIEFRIKNAKGGEMCIAEHGEVLDRDGNFYNENYRTAEPKFTYITRAGEQTYKARYTFYGFRYVKINEWCEPVLPENFTALVMHSDMKRTGELSTGNAKLNRLYQNALWSNRDNFLDIPTDCPQRDERLGWTNDAHVFCRTASINFDTERFFTKWLRDVALEQRENGRIPNYIPDITLGGDTFTGAAWGDAAAICPWEIYKAYGNKKLLAEHYPMMRGWLEYIHNDGDAEYLWLGGDRFNDWLAFDAPVGSYMGSTNVFLISTAFYYYSCSIVLKAARVLGRPEDEIKYLENMKKNIREAFINEYVEGERLKGDTQTAYVLAIHFGLCEGRPQLHSAFGNRLVELVEAYGDRLQTGFVGTPYLLDALTECGRADKAYTLLLQEKFPSWLFSVNMGATTIWEHWDGMNEKGEFWSTDMNSFNHYAFGSVCAWMYRKMCGIATVEDAPAYKVIDYAPIANRDIGHASAVIQTRNGEIKSAWVYEGQTIRYTLTLPDGVTARVNIDENYCEVTGGTHTFWSVAR